MSNETITKVSFADDEEVVITKKLRRSDKPNFRMIGSGKMNERTKLKSIDLLSEVMDMTKAEQRALSRVIYGLTAENDTGEVYVTFGPDKASKKKRDEFSRGFKLLERKNLMRRTKRGHYMVNPNALIMKEYDKAMIKWSEGEIK